MSTIAFQATFARSADGADAGTSKTCYVSFASVPEIVTFDVPKTTASTTADEVVNTLFARIDAARAVRPGQISISVPPQLIFSRNYGITFSLGIDDYSDYLKEYQEECIHQFGKPLGGTFVTIVRKSMAQQLVQQALQLWGMHHDESQRPTRIMLRCDSTPQAQATITDAIHDADAPCYFDVTALCEESTTHTETHPVSTV